MKTVIAQNNQSLLDIAIQEYGSVEAVFDLAVENDMAITDLLTAGQEVKVPDSDATVPEVVAYYRRNGIRPATGDTNVAQTTPPAPSGGDCNWTIIND